MGMEKRKSAEVEENVQMFCMLWAVGMYAGCG